jgi:hypothetical protein
MAVVTRLSRLQLLWTAVALIALGFVSVLLGDRTAGIVLLVTGAVCLSTGKFRSWDRQMTHEPNDG